MAHAQRKDESGQMVLLNSQGETVRTFRIDLDEASQSAKLFVIYRHDTRRIEPHFQTEGLLQNGVSFDVLGETSQKELRLRPLQIGKAGSLSWHDGAEETVLPPSFDLQAEDDKKDLVLIGKWVGGAQVLLIAFVLILGHFLTEEKPAEDVTTIRAVELDQVKEKPPVVQMSERPVKQVAKVQPKVVKKVVKQQPTPRIVTRNAPKVQTKRQVTARVPKAAPAVENMGALGALGGLSKLKQSGGGLNLSGSSLARGQDAGAGGGGAGRGGAGGVSGALFGKGLIAASNGSGARAGSAGGYGTKGKGGGRQGYGTHNMAGASGGYVAPLDNESFVEGGLTRDQVDEVIQRNKGQIRYCYEKGLQGTPGLKGRVSINFVIGASGRVSTANVQQSSVDSSVLEGCVVAKLKNFKFPQPVGGVNVQVRYPFSFSRDLASN